MDSSFLLTALTSPSPSGTTAGEKNDSVEDAWYALPKSDIPPALTNRSEDPAASDSEWISDEEYDIPEPTVRVLEERLYVLQARLAWSAAFTQGDGHPNCCACKLELVLADRSPAPCRCCGGWYHEAACALEDGVSRIPALQRCKNCPCTLPELRYLQCNRLADSHYIRVKWVAMEALEELLKATVRLEEGEARQHVQAQAQQGKHSTQCE
jgi:hypothetical protein